MTALRATLTAFILAAAAVAVAGGAASAHDDEGIIAITNQTPDGLTVTYELALTYLNDNDPADGATVTAAADGPDGATIGPIRLEPTGQPGHYQAAVTYPVPGPWELRLSALSPIATLTAPVTINPPAPAAPPSSTPAAPTTTPPTLAAPTTVPTSTAAPDTTTPPIAPTVDADSDGGGGSTAVVAAVVAAILVAAGITTVVIRRRHAAG